MRIARLAFALFVAIALPSIVQSATYYIDFSGGSNSNPGTKVSPWKSHPYMQTGASCTGSGSAPTYTHAAGDHFIFKGGVSWPAACFQMSIPVGGSSGNIDYYGVDVTWFSGGSFTQPKFALANTVPTGNEVVNFSSAFGGYLTFDDFEIANQGITIDGGGVTGAAFQFSFVTGSMPQTTVQYVNMHDWTSTTDVATLPATGPGSGWTYSSGCINDGHNRVTSDHNICDDTNGYVYAGGVQHNVGWGGACGNCKIASNGVFRAGFAGCFTVSVCHDNEMAGIKQTAADLCPCRPHSQVIEDDFGGVIGMQAYNNYIHDNTPTGVTIYVNYSAKVYNNLMRNNSNGNILVGEPGGSHIGAGQPGGYAVNNTVDCSNGIACFSTDSKGTIPGPFTLQNDHFITNGNPISIVSAITTLSQSHNLTMSTTVASTQGYTSSNLYQPTASTNGTVNAGLNLSSLCGTLPGLCSDKLGNPRGTSWDIGAYEFGGGSSVTRPNPPTNLTATVQ